MYTKLSSLPPLDALRGFVAAARRRSITLAAEDLCLTQSAVSRQIQALEERLGQPLFVRKHRAIALTEAGEQLFQLASPWMDRLAEFTETLRGDARTRPVTVSASIGVASLWILPRLGVFHALHPDIDVRLATSNLVLDLQKEGIDLALRYCPRSQAPRDAIHLFDEIVVPVARPSIARQAFASRQALLQQTWLELDDPGRPLLRWREWLRQRGFEQHKAQRSLHFNQYDQVIHAALEGHGVALARLPLVLPMIKDGRLEAQLDEQFRIEEYAYWLVEAFEAPRAEVQALREWLVQEARSMLDELSAY